MAASPLRCPFLLITLNTYLSKEKHFTHHTAAVEAAKQSLELFDLWPKTWHQFLESSKIKTNLPNLQRQNNLCVFIPQHNLALRSFWSRFAHFSLAFISVFSLFVV